MKRSKALTQATVWMDLEHTILREADTGGHTARDSIYRKCPEQVHPQRMKVGLWWLGDRGGEWVDGWMMDGWMDVKGCC